MISEQTLLRGYIVFSLVVLVATPLVYGGFILVSTITFAKSATTATEILTKLILGGIPVFSWFFIMALLYLEIEPEDVTS